jgi:hypothetical protein
MANTIDIQKIDVEHVTIHSSKDFGIVKSKLESIIPRIDDGIFTLLGYRETTRHRMSAGLYAPGRVLLREDSDGVAFEYDRAISTFGQFADAEVNEVARKP